MADKIPIKRVRKMITCSASCIHEEASLLDVARIMVKDPKTRAVYVIDNAGKLRGIITLIM